MASLFAKSPYSLCSIQKSFFSPVVARESVPMLVWILTVSVTARRLLSSALLYASYNSQSVVWCCSWSYAQNFFFFCFWEPLLCVRPPAGPAVFANSPVRLLPMIPACSRNAMHLSYSYLTNWISCMTRTHFEWKIYFHLRQGLWSQLQWLWFLLFYIRSLADDRYLTSNFARR